MWDQMLCGMLFYSQLNVIIKEDGEITHVNAFSAQVSFMCTKDILQDSIISYNPIPVSKQ